MTCQARFSPSLRASALAGVVALGWLVAAPTAVVAQDGGYFSGVRFGQSGKAWSFTAPGLKLGQALEYSRGSDAGNTAFSGYQFENGLALGAALPPPVRANEAKATFNQAACFTNEAFADLRDLPPGVVLADLDAGPHIVAQTWHSAVAAPYQRIDKAMLKSLLVFGQPPREAADIVRETGATYIALCKTGVFAANARPNTLAEHLASGHPPSWATMLPASKGDYFLFRVERNRLPSTDEIRGREEI